MVRVKGFLFLACQERSEWVLGLSHTILLIIDSLLLEPQGIGKTLCFAPEIQ